VAGLAAPPTVELEEHTAAPALDEDGKPLPTFDADR
jgi:hypothetical protein